MFKLPDSLLINGGNKRFERSWISKATHNDSRAILVEVQNVLHSGMNLTDTVVVFLNASKSGKMNLLKPGNIEEILPLESIVYVVAKPMTKDWDSLRAFVPEFGWEYPAKVDVKYNHSSLYTWMWNELSISLSSVSYDYRKDLLSLKRAKKIKEKINILKGMCLTNRRMVPRVIDVEFENWLVRAYVKMRVPYKKTLPNKGIERTHVQRSGRY